MADSRIDDLRRRLERDPGSRLFAQLAEEHRKAGDLGEAIRVARAGLEQHPVYPSARLTLGRALLDSGDTAGARRELEAALQQAPDNILASRFLAQALEQLGELASALERYAATLKMAPGDAQLAAHVQQLATRVGTGGRAAAAVPAPRSAAPPLPRTTPPRGPAPKREEPTLPPLAPEIGGTTLPARPAPAVVALDDTARPVAPLPTTAPPLPPKGATTSPPAPAQAAPSSAPSTAEPAPQAPPTRTPTPATPTAPTAATPTADEAAAAAPFSSSTLAELYLRQGLQERAVEVYRQVLAEDPRNERARARLAAIEAEPPVSSTANAPEEAGSRARRRQVLERTIAGLEAMLASVRASAGRG